MVLRNLFSGQQWRCREQTCGHGWVRGRGAWDDGESNMEIYTLPYIYIFQYDSGSSNWYSVTIWRSGVWWDEGESFKKESVLSHVRCFTRTEDTVVTVTGDARVFSLWAWQRAGLLPPLSWRCFYFRECYHSYFNEEHVHLRRPVAVPDTWRLSMHICYVSEWISLRFWGSTW